MTLTSSRQKFNLEQQKIRFLRCLGAEDDLELYENILLQSFAGDAFEKNISAIFRNFYKQEKTYESFYESFLLWGERKIDDSFRLRWKVATANTAGLFCAFAISFLNPPTAIAIGVVASVTAGVYEGVAKRNIANFGHLQGHLSHKIHACTRRMLDRTSQLDSLTDDAKKALSLLEHPENKSKKSAMARMTSYFSGPVVSGIYNLISKFSSVSNVVSGVVGTFIPFLPMVTVGLSRVATNIRHRSAIAEGKFLRDSAEIIFNENSWKSRDGVDEEIRKLTQNFSRELRDSDNHGRILGEEKFHKPKSGTKDKNTNPTKSITFLPWLSAKVHKFIKRNILKKDVEDIAEKPVDNSSYIQIPKLDEFDVEEKKEESAESEVLMLKTTRHDDLSLDLNSAASISISKLEPCVIGCDDGTAIAISGKGRIAVSNGETVSIFQAEDSAAAAVGDHQGVRIFKEYAPASSDACVEVKDDRGRSVVFTEAQLLDHLNRLIVGKTIYRRDSVVSTGGVARPSAVGLSKIEVVVRDS